MSTTTAPRFTTVENGVTFTFTPVGGDIDTMAIAATRDGDTIEVGTFQVRDGWGTVRIVGATSALIVERFITAYMVAIRIGPRVAERHANMAGRLF
jgi:hypothetical protein